MLLKRLSVVLPLLIAQCLIVTAARAQPTISQSAQIYPFRLVNGVNEGTSTRPVDLNPFGVSYLDCASDMTLQFTVTLSDFGGSDSVEVWASLSSDCTTQTDRGIGATSAVCWGLRAGNLVDPVINTPLAYRFNVRVQDLVGWQASPPTPAEAGNPPPKGSESCTAQVGYASVPIRIDFLPIDGDGTADGTPFQYIIMTDLVGPPAPQAVSVSEGAGALVPNWTPNTDTDTVGYDVFLAPPAGPSPPGLGCPVIPGANDAGANAAGGGTSVIAATYLVGGEGDGITAQGESTGAYDVTGLADDETYAVAIAAVDGTGNVGPTSPPICASLATDGGLGEHDASLPADAGERAAVSEIKGGCVCSQSTSAGPVDGLYVGGAVAATAIALARRARRRA